MEDLKVAVDFTVRDSNNSIVQFLYGGDGMDCAIDTKDFQDIYHWS